MCVLVSNHTLCSYCHQDCVISPCTFRFIPNASSKYEVGLLMVNPYLCFSFLLSLPLSLSFPSSISSLCSFSSIDSGKPIHVPRVQNHGSIMFWNPERADEVSQLNLSFSIKPLICFCALMYTGNNYGGIWANTKWAIICIWWSRQSY